MKDSLYSLACEKKFMSFSWSCSSMASLMSYRESMYLPRSSEIFTELVVQICCHITGDDEDMRVMSLKPPAAMVFMSSSSESLSWTRFTSDADTTWGTWEIAAVI